MSTPSHSILAFFGLGGQEIAIIVFIIILLFGAKKLPELARGIGRSLGEFKKAKSDFDREVNNAIREDEEKLKQKLKDSGDSKASS